MDEKKVREAIEWMKNERIIHKCSTYISPSIPKEQINLIEEYYNLAIEALEKQLPKEIKAINPERSEESGDVEFCCPNCNSHYLYDITDVPNYCPECGIRFDT